MDILTNIEDDMKKFSSNRDKLKKKEIGQFFTPKEISVYMSSLIKLHQKKIKILDPGAGNGILACSILCEILKEDSFEEVHVDLYENDNEVFKLLENNLAQFQILYEKSEKKLTYNLINKDFIASNLTRWHDENFKGSYSIVISNPPYMKLRKNNLEYSEMNNIIFGQPNIYFLFMAMSIKLLESDGQFVFITPKSYLTGLYFTKFREWLVNEADIEKFSVFESRKNPFKKDSIVQEIIIIKGSKRRFQTELIEISIVGKNTLETNEIKPIYIHKDEVFDRSKNSYIRVPTTIDEYNALKFVSNWTETLNEAGYRVSTGKVVDFRNKEDMVNDSTITSSQIPLIWNVNLRKGEFIWPVEYKNKYQILKLRQHNKIAISNSNYLLIRRFTTKEESRRIQIVPYRKEMLKTDLIGIENHVNYLYKVSGEISYSELLGLFILFNSKIVDNYFRVLSTSTQVNANELNFMNFPKEKDIIRIGEIGEKLTDITEEVCNEILLEYFYNHENNIRG